MGKIVTGFFLIISILGVIAGISRYQSELGMAHQHLNNLGSQVLETSCGPIEYAQVGEGYPVFVIHGNGGGFDQGLALAQGYLGQGFQVIAPSRFGYLRSPLPAGASPASQADAYACLLDSLGIKQVAIYTISAGVTSSVQFALRYPERVSALILQSPNAPGKLGLVPPPQPIFSALMHSDFALWALTTYFSSSMQPLVGVPKDFSLTPEMQDEVDSMLKSILPASARGDGIVFDSYVSNPEINNYPLSDVQAPTLVISAVDDPEALHENARTLADLIPSARLLALPDGGHMLLGHTAEVKAEIIQFLHQNDIEMANNH